MAMRYTQIIERLKDKPMLAMAIGAGFVAVLMLSAGGIGYMIGANHGNGGGNDKEEEKSPYTTFTIDKYTTYDERSKIYRMCVDNYSTLTIQGEFIFSNFVRDSSGHIQGCMMSDGKALSGNIYRLYNDSTSMHITDITPGMIYSSANGPVKSVTFIRSDTI